MRNFLAELHQQRLRYLININGSLLIEGENLTVPLVRVSPFHSSPHLLP